MTGWEQRRKEHRAYRVENGLCTRCGAPADPDHRLCAVHREADRVKKARSTERHRERLAEERRAKYHAAARASEQARKQAETDARIAESERTGSLIPIVKRNPDFGELGEW